MKKSRIYTIVPAYNAEGTIRKVVSGLLDCGLPMQIIVVDDGSRDNTFDACRQFDISILRHERNQGKGAALQTGFRHALNQGAEVLFTLDADGQHDPDDLLKLFDELNHQNLDIVIGSRMQNTKPMPFHRILSNVITSRLLSWRTGQWIEDSQSGLRLIRANVLKNITLKATKFELESELLIRAALQNFRIGTVGVHTIYHVNGAESRSYMDAMDVIRFISLYLKSLTWNRSNQT